MIFFFNDTATTEIYTLSLHDALPILEAIERFHFDDEALAALANVVNEETIDWLRDYRFSGSIWGDRKSTRLNSSHANISYAVFCLKKKTGSFSNNSMTLSTSR